MTKPQPLPISPLPPVRGRESLKSWSIRWLLNRLPSYRRAGGKLVFLASDLTFARVRVKYGWRTYGQKNSIFGGALYATIDPCYVIMLQWRLCSGFAVWDKSATIDFRKPGRAALYSDFACSENELAAIRREAHDHGHTERVLHVELRDAAAVVHAAFEKAVVIKRRKAES